jgi:hypothetical protein
MQIFEKLKRLVLFAILRVLKYLRFVKIIFHHNEACPEISATEQAIFSASSESKTWNEKHKGV